MEGRRCGIWWTSRYCSRGEVGGVGLCWGYGGAVWGLLEDVGCVELLGSGAVGTWGVGECGAVERLE